MSNTFQIIALSSLDIEGADRRAEPHLLYPEALTTAKELKAQGKAFRVVPAGDWTEEQRHAFEALGAVGQ